MSFRHYTPSAILKPYIRRYMVVDAEDDIVNRLLPDTSLVVALRYRGKVNLLKGTTAHSLPSPAISGLRKSVRFINYTKDSAAIIVLFKEAGAGVFFKEPLYELFEQNIPLQHFTRQRELFFIEEQLAEATNDDQRISIIEQIFISMIRDMKTDKLVAAAVNEIYFAKGIIRMKELADKLYISQDAFEKRFRKAIGTSPKQFSSIIRMKSVISSLQQGQSFTGTALDAGFFDQPHFNKEFKLFTGSSPADFLKIDSFW